MDAALSHEIGHQRLHSINAKNPNVDFDKMSEKTYNSEIQRALKYDRTNNEKLKRLRLAQDIHPMEYMKKLPDKETQKQRDDIRDYAKRYENKKDSHSDVSEFEADRYSANKTSDRAMKKAINQSYKFVKSDKKKNSDEEKSKLNSAIENDKTQRFKALKDEKMKSSKIYKED